MSFNITLRYIDDVHSHLSVYVDHIYTIELEVKDITLTVKSAQTFNYIHFETASEIQLRMKRNEKRENILLYMHFSFVATFMAYISQLIYQQK